MSTRSTASSCRMALLRSFHPSPRRGIAEFLPALPPLLGKFNGDPRACSCARRSISRSRRCSIARSIHITALSANSCRCCANDTRRPRRNNGSGPCQTGRRGCAPRSLRIKTVNDNPRLPNPVQEADVATTTTQVSFEPQADVRCRTLPASEPTHRLIARRS